MLHRSFLLIAAVLSLMASGCVTLMPSRPGWRVADGKGQASLFYGRAGRGQADFSVVCDIDAGVADLIYYVGYAGGFVEGASTELLVASDEDVDNLPAVVRAAGSGEGLAVVARTLIPPAPIAEWAGKTITVGSIGRATTLTIPPDQRTIDAFLGACRRRA